MCGGGGRPPKGGGGNPSNVVKVLIGFCNYDLILLPYMVRHKAVLEDIQRIEEESLLYISPHTAHLIFSNRMSLPACEFSYALVISSMIACALSWLISTE